MEFRDFTVDTQNIVKSGPIESYGTDIEFYNQGSDVVVVNSRTLNPGESWNISGFPGERNVQPFRCVFQTTSNPKLVVSRRLYTNVDYRSPAVKK